MATPGTCAALAVLGWASFAAPARAAPPRAGGIPALHPPEVPTQARRMLDLRAPTALSLSADAPAVGPTLPLRRLALEPPMSASAPPAEQNFSPALRALGASLSRTREMSRAELWARQLHHDGLPLLRPWENHAAFLSLGLNARGKPGLWLVQKTH